jgi:hypothetical protein
MLSTCSSVKPIALSDFLVSAMYILLCFGGVSSPLEYAVMKKERSNRDVLSQVQPLSVLPAKRL